MSRKIFKADFDFTIQIENADKLVGIELLDYVIVSKTNHFSFLANNTLNNEWISHT